MAVGMCTYFTAHLCRSCHCFSSVVDILTYHKEGSLCSVSFKNIEHTVRDTIARTVIKGKCNHSARRLRLILEGFYNFCRTAIENRAGVTLYRIKIFSVSLCIFIGKDITLCVTDNLPITALSFSVNKKRSGCRYFPAILKHCHT